MYQIFALPRFKKDISKLPPSVQKTILEKIDDLRRNLFGKDIKKLKNSPSDWRLRVDDYRIVFELKAKDNQILLLHVAHRRDVYR